MTPGCFPRPPARGRVAQRFRVHWLLAVLCFFLSSLKVKDCFLASFTSGGLRVPCSLVSCSARVRERAVLSHAPSCLLLGDQSFSRSSSGSPRGWVAGVPGLCEVQGGAC